MKTDFYVDSIMGDWRHDKKGSTKEALRYTRKAPVKLHRDYAVAWTDPKDFKEYKVFGDVVLTEQKVMNVATSATSFFRGVELTATTEKAPVIK